MAYSDYEGTTSTASSPHDFLTIIFYRPTARAVHYVLAGIAAILFAISHNAWRFTDIPADVVSAMDALAQQFAGRVSTRASAFRAFVSRALTHPSYVAGHFDPGRMPA